MANYTDYAKNDIDDEIIDAAGNQQSRDELGRFIPERFKGKSAQDIAQSYEELEKMNSRQAQDLGDMRRTVDQMLELQLQKPVSPAPVDTAPLVTVDDLYDDADGQIRRLAREESSSRIEALEKKLAERDAQAGVDAITSQFPTWKDDAAAPEFMDWVREKKSRVMLVQAADALDFEAAEELLGSYYDQKAKAPVGSSAADNTQQQLRDATLESGSPAPTDLVDNYSRSALMEYRIKANQGSQAAARYLAAHADSIAQAYAEGRIVD